MLSSARPSPIGFPHSALLALVFVVGCTSTKPYKCSSTPVDNASEESTETPTDLAERIEDVGRWLPPEPVVLAHVRSRGTRDASPRADSPDRLQWMRTTVEELIERRVGLAPTSLDSVVLGIGARWSVLVAEGPVEFAADETSTEVAGRKVRRLQLDRGTMSPLWALETKNGGVAVFTTGLGLRRALRRVDGDASGPSTPFADGKRWQSLRPIFAQRHAPLAVGVALESQRWQDRFRRWFYQNASMSLRGAPSHIGATWGDALHVQMRGDGPEMSDFIDSLQRNIDDHRVKLSTIESNLDHMPLPLGLTGAVGTEMLRRSLTAVEFSGASGPIRATLPVSLPAEGSLAPGIAAMYLPYLAQGRWASTFEAPYRRAVTRMRSLREALQQYFGEHCRFPESAGPVPARASCCPPDAAASKPDALPRCQVDGSPFRNKPWTSLDFDPGDDQYFAYEIQSNGKSGADARLQLTAYADFDCDGDLKHRMSVELQGTVDHYDTDDGRKKMCGAKRVELGLDENFRFE